MGYRETIWSRSLTLVSRWYYFDMTVVSPWYITACLQKKLTDPPH